ncbi:hypothetical protein SAMN02982919_00973 [Giesbergeria anulus]|uniref:Uncharacterized protein n=1 Tax=Giesbergeria anulus TaxID=180197 RepID=A0A1H9I0J4_9BURK|nr:hypothetical protein SAMN02982919_00973 [Giesbergeria anulus]
MRKQKKLGRRNCGACTTKKIGASQLEGLGSKFDKACRGLGTVYHAYNAYRGFEVLKSLIDYVINMLN